MLKINGKELIIQLSDEDFECLVAPKPNGLRLASIREAEDLMVAGSELLTHMPSFPCSFINKSLVAETLAQSKGLTLYSAHVTEEEDDSWEQEDEEWDDEYDEYDSSTRF